MKKLFILILFALSLSLFACTPQKEDTPPDVTPPDSTVKETYTVTWKNHDGSILETDTDVPKDSLPVYNGSTPEKASTEDFTYTFSGWSPTLTNVVANVTYTAVFTESPIIKDEETYTVTWTNYDGTVLESDTNISKGSMPEYNGSTPEKPDTDKETYSFSGWTPNISAVTADITYTATFTSSPIENPNDKPDDKPDDKPTEEDNVPVLSADGKSVYYGLYPQTRVSDSALIAALGSLSPSSVNGWYLYGGNYYAKIKATVYNGEKYTFDDGTSIVDGTEYWFKCEPIKWNILKDENGNYYLLSEMLLDATAYYSDYGNRTDGADTVYANNYEKSDIRAWLNGEFYSTAFALGNSAVKNTFVNNGASTTDTVNNIYASAGTTDKVFLPSYSDYLNSDYGFNSTASEKSDTRVAKTTDYARARGAWCFTRNNSDKGTQHNGSYWTRSASGEYYYCATVINSGGFISTYAVDEASHSVRPAIYIDIDSIQQ